MVSRKAPLAIALAGAGTGIELNEHLEHADGALVFQHAWKLGFEGIISKQTFALCIRPFDALDHDEEFEVARLSFKPPCLIFRAALYRSSHEQ